jgi:hypothetical protein
MGRTAGAIANFFRLAFWPLAAAILVVLLLQPLYFLSLASLGSLTSRERTVAHLGAAFDAGILSDDGNPRVLIFKGGEQLTECISLGIGLNQAETSWQSAITGSYPMAGSTHACEGLHHAVTGAPASWQPYFRYWHGYRLILDPLISAFPLWLVKIINVLMLVTGAWLLCRALCKVSNPTVAAIFLITFAFLSDVLFVWRTSTHSISLAYIFSGAALFAWALRKDWSPPGLIVLAAVLGSAFNFIDFLINPPMMPMLIAFFILLSNRPNAGVLALSSVIAWFAGYSETWLTKWILAYAALPSSAGVASDVLSTAEMRIVGAFNGVYLVPLAATVRTFARALSRAGVIVPLIITVAVAHYAATVSRIDWRRALWLCSPVLVPVLWFEALSSHTQFHLTPSSRSAAMALAVILSTAIIAMQQRPTISDLYAHLRILIAKLPLSGSNRRR